MKSKDGDTFIMHVHRAMGFYNRTWKKIFSKLNVVRSIYIVFLLVNCITTYAQKPEDQNSEVVDIGSQRQLFIDNFLGEKFTGGAELRLHHPVIQEIALLCDKPWEGSFSNYNSIFKDGDIYRMYYRG
ncbi:MAG: hypothetical protein ABI168_06440, partial [Ginsengibacter sp.]